MAGGGLPGNVVTAYDNLLQELADASAKANCGFVEWTPPLSSCFKPEGDVTKFGIHLHLAEWKAHEDTISILVHAQETIRRSSPPTLQSSAVLLVYYRIDAEGRAHQLHSVHFDYDGEKDNHPVFHAQLCNDTVQLSEEDARQLQFQYQVTAASPLCFKRARIPTSDMTLPSVLLCAAADHLKKEFFAPFLEAVLTYQDKMPLPPFARTRASMAGAPNHLRSSHWFAHMSGT